MEALTRPLRVALAASLVGLNTIVHCSVLFVVALLKFLLGFGPMGRAWSRLLVLLAESWISCNNVVFAMASRTRWEVQGLEGLSYERSYLVLANHQSWVDIPVLQKVFNRRIPFLRFFLKSQLIWVPLLGLAWWALDFPFMKRYSRERLERSPELRGTDIAATRKACAKFRDMPVSVMNFVEGTRFTDRKHARGGGGYTHLLRPKSGGVAFVLDAMGDALHAMLDVTIRYPLGRPTLVDLLAGRVRRIQVHVQERSIPPEMLGGDYENDPEYRARFQGWINGLWAEKDARLEALCQADKGADVAR
ncbi:acyltransferase [Pseudomarimonas salicorniae]|uniref:Acyltransferase n=1 Tax=Pseudomarimonas salicorniae TaxID=2933270 RepID=A0ABT0GLE2_9GAMM|nr:acyltransferase [Lysobacter sp. CAU 1642]MCK7594867.1 acyltransferase [Lysobacter sp. CAU 1642]